MIQHRTHEVITLNVVQEGEQLSVHAQVLTVKKAYNFRVRADNFVLEFLIRCELWKSSINDCWWIGYSGAIIADRVDSFQHV